MSDLRAWRLTRTILIVIAALAFAALIFGVGGPQH